jgi:hypothetical protein
MNFHRKITAVFFALLITLISIAYPVVPSNEWTEVQTEERVILLVESSLQKLNFIQKTSSSEVATGWKSEVNIPWFNQRNVNFTFGQPEFQCVGKIFVSDINGYKPCKSLLLFPFHDFL